MDEEDVDNQLAIITSGQSSIHPASLVATRSNDGKTIVSFEPNDPDNPYNWSTIYKFCVIGIPALTVVNSTMASGLAAGGSVFSSYFHVTDSAELVLPTSMYLVGYFFGPLLFGPLSEQYGRRWVSLIAFALFTIFTMACALAPNWPALIVFRLLVGIPASCPITVVGGVCADIFATSEARGRAMAIFMASTVFGPLIGPIISGYMAPISWRWAFWIGLIIAGVTWVPLVFVPETYGPVLLKYKAQKLRKETDNPNIVAAIELEKHDIRHIITVVLTRPLRMMFFEPLVLFSCVYLTYVYGVFYMFFQAFPIIYQETYGFTAGQMGLAFLPIGVGAAIAMFIYLGYDIVLRRARAAQKPWATNREMQRLPLACIGGPFIVASLFWTGWTARPSVHWICPVLAGIFYGIGYLLIFMALLNHLVDAYEIFAASAMAAAGTMRSLGGAVLPFAARPLYEKLGVPWACSLLGFLSAVIAVVPFVFIRYGDQIRARSRFCRYLEERRAEAERKKEREAERARRREKAEERSTRRKEKREMEV
ncbi:MFS general substrate transporter [Aulographum hederae CBS 113979]|uniref:MFS general substrate transporter n=1 Tax=Aulographum hederae CBS 113979 TaxID=1176131 RepID=A0A6G1GZX1_9PEZI|nr:MFS general substrate transporter [Aulographum hederae CBS 113979]